MAFYLCVLAFEARVNDICHTVFIEVSAEKFVQGQCGLSGIGQGMVVIHK